MDDFIYFIYGL